MKNNEKPFLLYWLDWILVFFALFVLVVAYGYAVYLEPNTTAMASLLFMLLGFPLIIYFKVLGTRIAYNKLSRNLSLVVAHEKQVQIMYPRTVSGGVKVTATTDMNLPNCYLEYIGGDESRQLTVKKYSKSDRLRLSGEFEYMTELNLYAHKDSGVESLSLYTPEVLYGIIQKQVPCSIELRGSSIELTTSPNRALSDTDIKRLVNLVTFLREEITQQSRTFNVSGKQFGLLVELRRSRFGRRISRFTDQAKVCLIALSLFASLSFLYAADVGSGAFTPVVDIPDPIGLLIVSFFFVSPYFMILYFGFLPSLTTTVRVPSGAFKLGTITLGRATVFFVLFFAAMFALLYVAATPG